MNISESPGMSQFLAELEEDKVKSCALVWFDSEGIPHWTFAASQEHLLCLSGLLTEAQADLSTAFRELRGGSEIKLNAGAKAGVN